MADQKIVPKHDHATLTFPEGFLWGAATSSHQVEGNNTKNDWWEFEATLPQEKKSGQACDQYNRYDSDFELAKSLGHNTHRLSIEWSRIEPLEGKFDDLEIKHYKKVLKSLKDKGLVVMLTLHHFTNPLWFIQKGGWESGKSVKYFERFVKRIVPELKDYVDLWITINEPGVYMWGTYLVGVWPPRKKSNWKALKTYWHMARAHKKAYKAIHQIIPNAQVGMANNLVSFDVFHDHSLRENIAKWLSDIFSNHMFYILTGKKTHDFLGINYYFHRYISFNGHAHIPRMVDIYPSKKDVSDMGWEVHPDGIFDVLMDFSDYHKPIYITENGLATTNDDRRVRFLLSYLKEIYHAIQMGADVKGYYHWSLLDNFEWIIENYGWAEAYEPKFGLIEVDFKTQKRTPKPSARVYREIIKNNGIPHHLLKLLGHGIKVEEVIGK